MTRRNATTLALCILALATAAPGGALAQADNYGKSVDLKPLLPPILPPLLPPNSLLTPGSAYGDSPSPYSRGPLNDPTRDQATPGLRLTIPTR
jgi:hypothetical protein